VIATLDYQLLLSDPWLGEILGVPTYRLNGGTGDLPRASGPRFLYCATKKDDDSFAAWLRSKGFHLADEALTYVWKGRRILNSSYSCRYARSSDEESVARIARTGFSHDRFHRDASIPNEIADTLKEAWARNFFRGLRGDHMLVAETAEGAVVGFLQILRPDSETYVIDLTAVAPCQRGTGHGTALIQTLQAKVKPGAVVRVGTQKANTASVAFYEKLGFALVATTYVYHRHDT
tara:strand:+ start:533 stop:1234 length:702 start_codon:yes stop_codon:yes gene_type:complete